MIEQLEERFALAVTLVSTPTTGGVANGNSSLASVSDDGRYVAFWSDASNLVANDTNGVADIFVKDLSTGNIVRANTSSLGEQANGNFNSTHGPVISRDGRLVAFASHATNLISGVNQLSIYVKDLQTGSIQRLNQDENGISNAQGNFYASFSADNRYVAFSIGQVYVKDLQTGVLSHVSTTADGTSIVGYKPALSADGKYIAFYSLATILPEDLNYRWDIYVKNLETREYKRVPTYYQYGTSGPPSHSLNFSMSDDGRFIAFHSDSSQIVPNDSLNTWDSFVTEVSTGNTIRINTTAAGQVSDAAATLPVISGDGRYVAFQSTATNLVNDPTQSSYQRIYVKDLQTGEIRIAAETPYYDPDTTLLTTFESFPVISANGRYVAFQSTSNAHVQNDTNVFEDIFLSELFPATPVVVPATVNLKLTTASDTGSSSTDRITNDTTPTFEVTVNQAGTLSIDLNGDGQADPVDFGNGIVSSFSVLGAGSYTFTTPVLSSGSHAISARFAPPTEPAATDALAIVIDTLGLKITSAVPGGDAAGVLSHFIVSVSEELGSPISSVQFTGPNGTIPVTVTALSSLTYRVEFLPQATAGAYELLINSTGIRDLANNALDQNENGVSGETADFFHNIYAIGNSTGNILWNGNAELGSIAGPKISNYTPYSIPGWKVLGNSLSSTAGMIGQRYDEGDVANINLTTFGPLDRGSLYFVGGYQSTTFSRQQVWLGEYATAIDAGLLKYDLSGWLGGFFNHPDNAAVTLTFLDSAGQLLVGSATLIPVTAVDRNNVSGMLYREALDLGVPVGARQAIVTIAMQRVLGSFNNAAADNLQLTLRQAPIELALNPPSGTIDENLARGKVSITLSRTGDFTQPLTVNLQSSDTTELTVPATVTFDAGQNILTFDASVIRDGLVDGTQAVTITAFANGLVTGNSTINVTDSDSPLLSISLDQSQVTEGGSVFATITRNSNLDTALAVSLAESSQTTAVAQFLLPAVTISLGQQSVIVALNTLDDTRIEVLNSVTLTATATGYPVASADVNVFDNDVQSAPVVEVSVLEDSGAYRLPFSLQGGSYAYSADVSYSIVSGDTNLFASPPKLVSEYYQQWYLEFTPQANANGVALVHVISKDMAGQIRGEYDFFLEVKSVNDAPSFNAGGNITVLEDSGPYAQGWASVIQKGPANESAQLLIWSVIPENPALFSVQPTIGQDGRLIFTPAPNAVGTTLLTATLRDNGGTANGGSDAVQKSFTVTIEPQPDPGPTITAIEFWTSTGPVAAPFLAPISAIVVTFDRVMSDSGVGDVRARHHWELSQDGHSLNDKISALQIVSNTGEPTQLRISFTEPLGAGSYLLVAAPTLTDAQGIPFEAGEGRIVGAGHPIPFRVSVSIVETQTKIPPTDPETKEPAPRQTTAPILELPRVVFFINPQVNPLLRIQAGGESEVKDENPEPRKNSEPLPPMISTILRIDYTATVALQPEISITGFGTTFITNTIPDFPLDEDGDEFLSRDQVKERLAYIQRPEPETPNSPRTRFSWWWVGLGLSSLLGGIGYYTLQRRLANRNKSILTNNTSPTLHESGNLPITTE